MQKKIIKKKIVSSLKKKKNTLEKMKKRTGTDGIQNEACIEV